MGIIRKVTEQSLISTLSSPFFLSIQACFLPYFSLLLTSSSIPPLPLIAPLFCKLTFSRVSADYSKLLPCAPLMYVVDAAINIHHILCLQRTQHFKTTGECQSNFSSLTAEMVKLSLSGGKPLLLRSSYLFIHTSFHKEKESFHIN